MTTIRHNDSGKLVVVAKLLMGILSVKAQIKDPESYIKANQTFDANFVATVCAWQGKHGLTNDGVIGDTTWAALAKNAPTCSTAKNRTSAATLAAQILLDSNITCDGVYGKRTKNAVAVYQDAMKLTADGICGPRTWRMLITGSNEAVTQSIEPAVAESVYKPGTTGGTVVPVPGKFQQPVDYKQADPRWGKKMYSSHGNANQTMANSACGPTSMADIIASLVDRSMTPYDLAQLALKYGDRTAASGTAWSFFTHMMKHFNFKKMVQTKNLSALKACLDAGGYVVCSMGPGYWTKGGHFICAWKYDNNYIYANDPASSKRTKQKTSDFTSQRKQYFCFYPERN